MSSTYKILKQQTFSNGKQSIVPIRMEDSETIRKWRNEQIFHLRQSKLLSKEDQETYFNTVVKSLFSQDQPNQILFSFIENDQCVGYGGLVHINWIDKHAEISFVTATHIEQDRYEYNMSSFLGLLQEVATNELHFHKIFTYAFDVRPKIYGILEKCGFHEEAVLKGHCHFDGAFIDVIIHSKFI